MRSLPARERASGVGAIHGRGPIVSGRRPRLKTAAAPCEPEPMPTDSRSIVMCRNIRPLHNFEPPATEAEVRAAALQFVRKLSGSTRPSRANQAAFDLAVDRIADAIEALLASLISSAAPRDRDIEADKARARAEKRYGTA